MKSVAELREEQSHSAKCMEDIIAEVERHDRVMNAEEQKRFDEHKKSVEQYAKLIEEAEAHESRKTQAQEVMDQMKRARQTVPAKPANDDGPPNGHDLNIDAEMPARYSKLVAFKDTVEGRRTAYRCGRWLRATVFGDTSSQRWCVNHGMELRALSEGINTAGGTFVPEEFAQAIIDLREQYGIFRQNCDIIPMGRDLMTVPSVTGGFTPTFKAENAQLGESDPTTGNVTLTAKKLGGITRISTELAEDAFINVADFVAREMARGFALLEDTCGFAGTGTAAQGGIVGIAQKFTNDNTLTAAVDATSGNDQFTEIDLADLHNVMGTLPEYAIQNNNAAWYCSALARETCFARLAAAGGGNTVMTLANGMSTPAFLGYPIRVSQVLPSVTTALNNTTMLLFGDLRLSSIMGDRRGISISVSDQRYLEFDQIAIRATERMDINNHGIGDTSTAGPIVALIGNT